jgi:hypothetical protein
MSKHTPGPWKAVIRSNQSGVRNCFVTNEAHTKRFFQAPGDRGVVEADVANAHLIAAAPDLLAALRNITECAEAGDDGCNMDLWIEQARAAIAKAEGRS